MDLIKIDTNSDDEEDPISHHKEEFPLAIRVLKVESHVSTFRLGMACFLETFSTTLGHHIHSAGSSLFQDNPGWFAF
jgi:hypothetical protein